MTRKHVAQNALDTRACVFSVAAAAGPAARSPPAGRGCIARAAGRSRTAPGGHTAGCRTAAGGTGDRRAAPGARHTAAGGDKRTAGGLPAHPCRQPRPASLRQQQRSHLGIAIVACRAWHAIRAGHCVRHRRRATVPAVAHGTPVAHAAVHAGHPVRLRVQNEAVVSTCDACPRLGVTVLRLRLHWWRATASVRAKQRCAAQDTRDARTRFFRPLLWMADLLCDTRRWWPPVTVPSSLHATRRVSAYWARAAATGARGARCYGT